MIRTASRVSSPWWVLVGVGPPRLARDAGWWNRSRPINFATWRAGHMAMAGIWIDGLATCAKDHLQERG